MNFSPLSVQMLCRWLLIAGWIVILCACPAVAQTPYPESSDDHPSAYLHPLRTWVQSETPGHRQPGRLRATTSESLQDRLHKIIIPEIRFERTTLSDAVEFLRQEIRRLDTNPDPNLRGVRVNLITRPTPPVPTELPSPTIEPLPSLSSADLLRQAAPPIPSNSTETRITFTMYNVPMLEALRYVAQQAGLEIKVGTDQVWIVPVRPRGDLETEEFRLRPRWLRLHQNAAKLLPSPDNPIDSNPPNRYVDAKPFLEVQGITFPPGANAVYLPRKHKLVLRDTPDNIDLAKDFFELSPEELELAPESANP